MDFLPNHKKKFRFLQFSSDNSVTIADINLILAPNYSLAWGAVQRHGRFPSRC